MKRRIPAIALLALFGTGAWMVQRSRQDVGAEQRGGMAPVARPAIESVEIPRAAAAESAATTGVEPASSGTLLIVPEVAPVLLQKVDVPWEMQLAAITARSDMPDRLKARLLMQMLPGLAEEALATAAEEAVQRVPDADYAAVVLPAVLDPQTHGAAMSVLFADLMERPDAVALPALLAMARNPAHPFAPSAEDNLRLLLGADPARWDGEIQRRLKGAEPRIQTGL